MIRTIYHEFNQKSALELNRTKSHLFYGQGAAGGV